MDKATQQAVRDRAGRRCEYCYFPESFAELPFHINRTDAVAVRQLLMEAGVFAVAG
jgi:hypothetical protein